MASTTTSLQGGPDEQRAQELQLELAEAALGERGTGLRAERAVVLDRPREVLRRPRDVARGRRGAPDRVGPARVRVDGAGVEDAAARVRREQRHEVGPATDVAEVCRRLGALVQAGEMVGVAGEERPAVARDRVEVMPGALRLAPRREHPGQARVPCAGDRRGLQRGEGGALLQLVEALLLEE